MQRPLAQHRKVSCLAFTCLFTAFILLLLVALSLPIIKPIYIISIKSKLEDNVLSSIATELRFGVWGLCATSTLDQPLGLFGTKSTGLCFGPQLGYNIPPEIAELKGVSAGVVDAVSKGLLVVLVLHPIAAGLSFIGFIFSLCLASHGISILCLLVSTVTGILTTIVFGVDLALVILVRNNITDVSGFEFDTSFGPAVWMVFVAFLLTWIAVVVLSARACYCCGVRRHEPHHHHHHHKHHENEMGQVSRDGLVD